VFKIVSCGSLCVSQSQFYAKIVFGQRSNIIWGYERSPLISFGDLFTSPGFYVYRVSPLWVWVWGWWCLKCTVVHGSTPTTTSLPYRIYLNNFRNMHTYICIIVPAFLIPLCWKPIDQRHPKRLPIGVEHNRSLVIGYLLSVICCLWLCLSSIANRSAWYQGSDSWNSATLLCNSLLN